MASLAEGASLWSASARVRAAHFSSHSLLRVFSSLLRSTTFFVAIFLRHSFPHFFFNYLHFSLPLSFLLLFSTNTTHSYILSSSLLSFLLPLHKTQVIAMMIRLSSCFQSSTLTAPAPLIRKSSKIWRLLAAKHSPTRRRQPS